MLLGITATGAAHIQFYHTAVLGHILVPLASRAPPLAVSTAGWPHRGPYAAPGPEVSLSRSPPRLDFSLQRSVIHLGGEESRETCDEISSFVGNSPQVV